MSLSVSALSGLAGCQEPSSRVVPSGAVNFDDALDAVELAASYGLVADRWQAGVLEAWMGRDGSGRWAAGTVGVAVPRQNGKNAVLEIYELFCMVILGAKILHTAHEVKTARKHFKRIAQFFDAERGASDELASLVSEIRYANGQEAIFLSNGGSIEMVARSKNSARGFTVDIVVIDEAQEFADEALESIRPTMSSGPMGDPQMVYSGTPPSELMNGAIFTRVRDAALGGADRMAWCEWSVSVDVDIHDPAVWASVNPSLGTRLLADVILSELNEFSEDGFYRERLGRWSEGAFGQVIPSALWDKLGLDDEKLAERRAAEGDSKGLIGYALDMNPERTCLSVCVAYKTDSGVHVELVARDVTPQERLARVRWLAERWPDTAAVVIDGQSPAATMVEELKAAKVKVIQTTLPDMAKACGMFVDACYQGRLSHFKSDGQADLDRCLPMAKKRSAGNGGLWAWDRMVPDADISPIVAATLALYGVETTKRRPGRKAVATF